MLQLIKISISSCMRMLITVLQGYAFISEPSVEPDNKANGKSPVDETAQKQAITCVSQSPRRLFSNTNK